MKKKYNYSEECKIRDEAQRDWKYRLEIATFKLKGLNNTQIAKKYGVTPEAIRDIWNKIKDIPVSEIEERLGSKITINLE